MTWNLAIATSLSAAGDYGNRPAVGAPDRGPRPPARGSRSPTPLAGCSLGEPQRPELLKRAAAPALGRSDLVEREDVQADHPTLWARQLGAEARQDPVEAPAAGEGQAHQPALASAKEAHR